MLFEHNCSSCAAGTYFDGTGASKASDCSVSMQSKLGGERKSNKILGITKNLEAHPRSIA
jgi:hypothetical protein